EGGAPNVGAGVLLSVSVRVGAMLAKQRRSGQNLNRRQQRTEKAMCHWRNDFWQIRGRKRAVSCLRKFTGLAIISLHSHEESRGRCRETRNSETGSLPTALAGALWQFRDAITQILLAHLVRPTMTED